MLSTCSPLLPEEAFGSGFTAEEFEEMATNNGVGWILALSARSKPWIGRGRYLLITGNDDDAWYAVDREDGDTRFVCVLNHVPVVFIVTPYYCAQSGLKGTRVDFDWHNGE